MPSQSGAVPESESSAEVGEISADQAKQQVAKQRSRTGGGGRGTVTVMGRSVDGDPSLRYVGSGPMEGLYTLNKGEEAPTRFLSWCPTVTEHLVRLDNSGECVERRYTLEVREITKTITSDDLVTGRAWRELVPTAKGIGRVKVRDALENVVTEQAVNLPITWMIKRTGWFTLPDGRWLYVRPTEKGNAAGQPVRTVALRADVVEASRPLAKPAGLPEQKRALRVLVERGWGPAFGFATGIRALAWSIVPVRGSLVPIGEPNSGKTLTLWAAMNTVMTGGWPPVVDASFNDTITAMEKKIGQATDRVYGVEDLPLTAQSAQMEVREAIAKFDRITRSCFNATAIRDRADRKGDLVEEPVYVEGIPVITAQRLPAGLQASALRRIVVAEFVEGDNDWRWYEKHGTEITAGLRTMGDKVVAALEKAGKEKAEAWVRECDQAARDRFIPVARAVIGAGAPDGIDGVLKAACQMLAGLLLVGGACKVDVEPLFESVMPKLAESLAHQARKMADEQIADTGLAEALGVVLRKSFAERKAHTRCPRENLPRAIVPGQTPQAQGLREDSFNGVVAFGGEGAGVYYQEESGLLGITPADLHMLVTAAKDPRLIGHTVKSLPSFLLKEKAVLRSTQKGQAATTKIRIGRGSAAALLPLVLFPAATVFTMPEQEDGDDQDVKAAPVPQAPEPSSPAPQAPEGDGRSEPQPELPTVPEVPAPAPAPTPLRVVQRAPAAAKDTRGEVIAVYGDRLWNAADARHVELSTQARTDLAALVAEAVAVAPAGPLTLLIGEDMHRGLRLQPEAPALDSDHWAKAFESLLSAGWHKPFGRVGQKPYVGRSVLLEHQERAGFVRITPVKWLSDDTFPRVRTRAMKEAGQSDTSDTMSLAYRLARFAELTGFAFESTFAATGITMMRAMVEASAKRHPKWQGDCARWPEAVDDNEWFRPLTEDEKQLPRIHAFDANKAYLPAYRGAIVARDDLRHYTGGVAFDDKQAGFWLLRVPEWPHPLLPAPLANERPGAMIWTTTSIVKLYVEVGISPECVEAWTAPRVEFQGLRTFTDTIRDLLLNLESSTDPDDQAVGMAVKELFHAVHGKLRNTKQGVMRRPDWGHAIRDAAWATSLRRAYFAAGLLKGTPDRPTPEVPVYPISVKTDELSYASDVDQPQAPAGITVGTGLGQFKAKAKDMTEWQTEMAAKIERAKQIKAKTDARRAARKAVASNG